MMTLVEKIIPVARERLVTIRDDAPLTEQVHSRGDDDCASHGAKMRKPSDGDVLRLAANPKPT